MAKNKSIIKYLITTDTHLGHGMLLKNGHRDEGYELKILRAIEDCPDKENTILIHLGDICIGNDEHWHSELMRHAFHFKRKILVRGNHDNKSYNWYYSHGWDFVCETMRMRYHKLELLFSHMPVLAEDSKYTLYNKIDMNIHGHLHGAGKYSHRAIEGYAAGFHYDVAPDTHDMQPQFLHHIIEKRHEQ